MIIIKKLERGSRKIRSLYILMVKSLLTAALILSGMLAPVHAQETRFIQPSWWFGAAAGANVNFFRGSTQELNSAFTVPAVFHNGSGVGLFLAPQLEFHRPGSRWGFMLQAGYDSRKGSFKEIVTPCNCPADLTTDLAYITVEPSIRLAPFKSNFYLYAGPRLAFNLRKSFDYTQKINPEFPEQVAEADVKGDFSSITKTLLSMQVGAGYDIMLSAQGTEYPVILSPFVSFQPYFGQDPRSIETWNVTTLRIGAAIKFGRGKKMPEPVMPPEPMVANAVVIDPVIEFTVTVPKNNPVLRTVREIFPLRNYVFFNTGSDQIPDRYVMLEKNQVRDFKEDQRELVSPKTLSGRSDRQMIVYYNVINILGDRMGKNPSVTIRLVGSSDKGPVDGKAMAESMKDYLVNVFGIAGSRIATDGLDKPKIPSEQPGGTNELVLLREGDQRVSIESSSPILLMEFQSGPDAPLRPYEIVDLPVTPAENNVSFNVEGAKDAFTSWSMNIEDADGRARNFGPYTQDIIRIPGNTILGTVKEGDYKVIMTGTTRDDRQITKQAFVHLVLWAPPVNEEMTRYSIIYEFNDSKAIMIYDRYLTEVVVPKIPINGTVSIHGYTDIIGEAEHNQKLSLARANDVKVILERGLAKAGRTDVKFEVYGVGEDPALSPFENKYPEERFYNRTVMIDLIHAISVAEK